MNGPSRQARETDDLPPDEESAELAQEAADEAAEQAAGRPAGGEGGPAEEADFREKWLRALAEIDNIRRAARLDVDEARRYGATSTLLGLLPVLDNLQRALASPPAGLAPDFLAGLQLIEQQFRSALEVAGVSRVPAGKGSPLDPRAHRALLEQPSSDVAPGTILAEVQAGYRLHDRLLREAQVIVARAAAEPG